MQKPIYWQKRAEEALGLTALDSEKFEALKLHVPAVMRALMKAYDEGAGDKKKNTLDGSGLPAELQER